jgi:hypothetical protein
MQYVNIRHNNYDGNVAPHVSLGRSYIDRLPVTVPVKPRTATQILVDRDAAQAECKSLEASRADVLVNGSVEDLLALDTRIALAKAKQDQADAQHAAAVIAGSETRAENEAEQTRRKALRKAGVKASAEAGKLAERYVTMAQEMAGLLSHLREHERVIAEANRNLPEGAEAVPPGEPFNGTVGTPSHYETQYDVVRVNPDGSRAGVTSAPGKLVERRIPKDVCIPGTSGEPHIPLSHRVTLPSLGRDAPRIWGGIPYPITPNAGR